MENEQKSAARREILLAFAAKLGVMLRDSEEMKELTRAEKIYNECEALQAKVTEYTVNERAAAENRDPEIGVAITRRMEELYEEIGAFPEYRAYMEAQYAVRDLMNAVNGAIETAISGKPHCTPDRCATCKGCADAKKTEGSN